MFLLFSLFLKNFFNKVLYMKPTTVLVATHTTTSVINSPT